MSGLISYDDALVRPPVELPGSMANNSMKMVHAEFGQEIKLVSWSFLGGYWKFIGKRPQFESVKTAWVFDYKAV